jgi:hypothetical protein
MTAEHGHQHHSHEHPHPDEPHDHDEHGHAHPEIVPTDPREVELLAFVGRVTAELAERDPRELADRAGCAYDPETASFELRVYGKLFAASFPDLAVHELAADHHHGQIWLRVLLAHYFRTADGAPLRGEWVSFRELPGGLMYSAAFQGYSGNELARWLGPDFAKLRELAPQLGGQPLTFGDYSFRMDVLPRVPIAIVCDAGDDEFPATARLLFDASAPRYLPTDALATLGGRLTRQLLHAAGIDRPEQKPITPGFLGRRG